MEPAADADAEISQREEVQSVLWRSLSNGKSWAAAELEPV